MHLDESYSLFQRESKKGKVWYFWYYPDVRNSSKRAQKSTGFTKKWQAKKFAEQFIAEFRKVAEPEIESITFREFTENFFVWGKCEWVKGQNEKDRDIDQPTVKMRRGHIRNYLWPEFGKVVLQTLGSRQCKLNAINVEQWLSAADTHLNYPHYAHINSPFHSHFNAKKIPQLLWDFQYI